MFIRETSKIGIISQVIFDWRTFLVQGRVLRLEGRERSLPAALPEDLEGTPG
ncbi:MAG: hypothetical protein ABW092_05810 [Candidatus Thiodiazotropha sp.]